MSMVCTVCSHAERKAIDRDLVLGKSVRHITARYGPSTSAAQRHRACISESLDRAGLSSALTAKSVILGLVHELRTMATECLATRASRDFLLVADRLTRATEVFGKLTGEISSGQVNALFVNLGVRDESEIRAALQVARSGSSLTLEELFSESIEALRFCVAERPDLRQSALMAIGADRIESGAVVVETNGHNP